MEPALPACSLVSLFCLIPIQSFVSLLSMYTCIGFMLILRIQYCPSFLVGFPLPICPRSDSFSEIPSYELGYVGLAAYVQLPLPN